MFNFIEKQWINIIEEGNKLYDKKKYKLSEVYYKKSLELVRYYLDGFNRHYKEQFQIYEMFVLSCHHLGNNFMKQKLDLSSEAYFLLAHNKMLKYSSANTISVRAKNHVYEQINETFTTLVEFYKKTNQKAKIKGIKCDSFLI